MPLHSVKYTPETCTTLLYFPTFFSKNTLDYRAETALRYTAETRQTTGTFLQQARLLNIYTLYNMFVGNMVNHACMKYMVSTVYIYIFILCGNVHVHFPNHSSNILLCVLFLSLSLYSFLSSGFLVACNEFIFRHFVLRF